MAFKKAATAAILSSLFLTPALFADVLPATFPTTTLNGSLTGWPAARQPATIIFLTSTSSLIPGQNPISISGIGTPVGHTNAILMVDTEAMCVTGQLLPNGGVPVVRGCQGTRVTGHSNGATVWVGPPSYYAGTIPRGTCDRYSLQVLPTVYIETAGVYDCVDGLWVYTGLASGNRSAKSVPVFHAAARPWYRRFFSLILGR